MRFLRLLFLPVILLPRDPDGQSLPMVLLHVRMVSAIIIITVFSAQTLVQLPERVILSLNWKNRHHMLIILYSPHHTTSMCCHGNYCHGNYVLYILTVCFKSIAVLSPVVYEDAHHNDSSHQVHCAYNEQEEPWYNYVGKRFTTLGSW